MIAPSILALASAPLAVLTSPVSIELADRTIRAGDLAVITGRADVPIAQLPRDTNSVVIAPDKARQLLRNRFPAASFYLHRETDVQFTTPAQVTSVTLCKAAARPIAALEVIARDDLKSVPCSDSPAASVWFDREKRATVAVKAIAAGEYLGRMTASKGSVVAKGQAMTFTFSQGPVTVERQVTALQSGRAGNKIFARTKDGQVIAATVADIRKEPAQ